MEGMEDLWLGFGTLAVIFLLLVIMGLEMMIVSVERKILKKLEDLTKK